MTNSARLSGRPSSSAAYNVGDVVDTPDSAIKSWRYLGAGEWEPNDAVRYTTGPGGGIAYPVTRNPGGGAIPLNDLLPTHRPILNPESINPATITAAAGVVATIADSAAGEFYRKDLVLTMAGVTALGYTTLPIPTDYYGTKAKVGFHNHFRVWCDDWSKVTNFSIWLYFAGTNDRVMMSLVSSGSSSYGCTDPNFASRWNGKYRTLQVNAPDRGTPNGTVPAWGTGNGTPTDAEIVGFRFQIQTSGACVIKINRAYSSQWPIGAFTLIGDGAYRGFREHALSAFRQRDWRGGVSLFVDADNDAVLPSLSDLRQFSDAGWDIFPHMRSLESGAPDAGALAGTETPAVLEASWRAISSRIRDNTSAKQAGLRFLQFLQNSGRSNVAGGVFTAQELGRFGVEVARSLVVDSEWGVDPFAAQPPYRQNTPARPLLRDGVTPCGINAGWNTGWIPKWGRYNYFSGQLYSTTSGVSTPETRDTYEGSLLQMTVERAAMYGSTTMQFTHDIVPLDGVQPTEYNSGLKQWRALLADLDGHVRAGKLIVLSPSELASVTYLRPGDVFVRWDGEWVYRHDPTKIAF